MSTPFQSLRFGLFRLDRQPAALWKGNEPLRLRPQSLAVLQYLADHPGRVVSVQELLDHNWPDTHVTDTVLRVCIRDIREVLQDTATQPQYLQTVRGQGYRFCAAVEESLDNIPSLNQPVGNGQIIVGRDAILDQLHAGLRRAADGEGQVLLVSGETGMGKTAVVETFLNQLTDSQPVCIGRGHCAEHEGPGEAYMPVLEALGRLGSQPEGDRLVTALRQAAPTWLLHLPLLTPTWQPLESHGAQSTRAQMQRELVDALTLFAAEEPLVLVFEDLHWSDPATTDLLTYIARRRGPGRWLVIGTYRPGDLAMQHHPLYKRVQALSAQGWCQVLDLTPLTVADIAAYVSQQLHGPVAPELPQLLQQRSGGNALFVVNALAYLLEHHGVQRHRGRWTIPDEKLELLAEVPGDVRQLIVGQIETLPLQAQHLLETASVAGDEFAVAAVAEVLSLPIEKAEMQYSIIARAGRMLEETGLATWPDGTISSRYRFRHTIYRQVSSPARK